MQKRIIGSWRVRQWLESSELMAFMRIKSFECNMLGNRDLFGWWVETFWGRILRNALHWYCNWNRSENNMFRCYWDCRRDCMSCNFGRYWCVGVGDVMHLEMSKCGTWKSMHLKASSADCIGSTQIWWKSIGIQWIEVGWVVGDLRCMWVG